MKPGMTHNRDLPKPPAAMGAIASVAATSMNTSANTQTANMNPNRLAPPSGLPRSEGRAKVSFGNRSTRVDSRFKTRLNG